MIVNEMVQIRSGYNSMGGMFIYEKFITGTVVKVNEKSIRVHMTHAKCTTNGKITRSSRKRRSIFDKSGIPSESILSRNRRKAVCQRIAYWH